jgi:acetyl esterase/lipase
MNNIHTTVSRRESIRRCCGCLGLTIALLCASLASAQQAPQVGDANRPQEKKRAGSYPAVLPGAEVKVYKKIGAVELNMYIFSPHDHKASDKRPAIVFFFGGGWKSGSPNQFLEHCKYLASRGMVAMTADYRVLTRHGTKAVSCVADAKSAVRWIRVHAAELGIDPQRVAAGGGSAGGHLAACTGVIVGFDESSEDTKISSRPNAMVLFNPALVLANIDNRSPINPRQADNLSERMGVPAEKLSPYHHVAGGAPPTVIFHGQADTTVKFWSAEAFTTAMKKAGNRCELHGYEGQQHGFFNYGRGGNKAYKSTIRELDKFLVSLNYLEGEPRDER